MSAYNHFIFSKFHSSLQRFVFLKCPPGVVINELNYDDVVSLALWVLRPKLVLQNHRA